MTLKNTSVYVKEDMNRSTHTFIDQFVLISRVIDSVYS